MAYRQPESSYRIPQRAAVMTTTGKMNHFFEFSVTAPENI
jgi:hypothetical protein